MCLHTYLRKPLIASEDITVYKLLKKSGRRLFALYYDTEYKLNKLYRTEIKHTSEGSAYDTIAQNAFAMADAESIVKIANGYHSSLSIKRLKDVDYDQHLYECRIPAGSEVYIGLTDLVVSNQIIVVKRVK